jgi:uncharacterized protein (DUF952 family)
MSIIYHITTKKEWREAKMEGLYIAPSLEMEGFIHCSEEHQIRGVLNRYFSGKAGLIKLVIDTDKLESRLQYDHSPSVNETFPHVYGPINISAVIEEKPVQLTD